MGRAGNQRHEDPVIGITEPDAGSDVAGIKTRAIKDGDEYVINGSKTYITNGHRAHAIVLVTKTDPGTTPATTGSRCSWSPWTPPGVIREKRLKKLGMHASDTALLAFQDVRVPVVGRARPDRARASTTSCGSSRASG